MNKNINSDINRFDGKYLKCIVSKYPSVINFLANSGSMIILQPQNDSVHQDVKEKINNNQIEMTVSNIDKQRNYIYLGDEFLASGYGFSTVNYRDSGERIIRTYDATIKALQKADDEESNKRNSEDEKIIRNFENYVKINGGPIENTIVNINGAKGIKTKDIILYGEEAKYDDFEIENVRIVLYDHNSIGHIATDNECVFPYGAIVSRIVVEITCRDNDSGGVKYLEVLHDFKHGDMQYDDNEGIIVRYDTDVDNKQILYDNVDTKFNSHKIFYSKDLNSSLYELIIDNIKENVIKDIYIYVKETPSINYKFYPNLLNCTYINSTENVKLISAGNAIKDHKIDLGTTLTIKPQYYIQYNFESMISLNSFNDDYVAPLNMIEDNYISNINIFLNNANSNKYLQIAVPTIFSLRKLYLVKNNLEKFNLTGGVYKIRSGILMPCPKSKRPVSASDKYYCMTYDIYMFIANNSIETNVNVELEIAYNGSGSLEIIRATQIELLNNFEVNGSLHLINDEEFNHLYWLNADKFDNEILINKLTQSQENGISK